MTQDGPGPQSIAERLKAKSAEDNREREAAIQSEVTQLAETLRQSSTDALKQTRESINAQIMEIEERISASRSRMLSALAEIEITPRRTIRKTMIVSATTGAIIAMIPWLVMSYLGISVTETAGTWLDRRESIRTEETRINALRGIEIRTIDGQEVLMLPATTTQIYQCGETRTPCIRIGE